MLLKNTRFIQQPLKFSPTIIILAFMSTLTPITTSYTFTFLLFVWLLLGIKSYSSHNVSDIDPNLDFSALWTPSSRLIEQTYRQLLKPFHIGVSLYVGFQVLSGIGAYFTSAYQPAASQIFKDSLHLTGKSLGLWLVLSQSVAILLRFGWQPRILLKPFFVWILIYLGYCLLQRSYGIDWVRGLSSSLGQNRLAYGVYRISGFMSHPLTLTYNLMTLFFLSLCLGRLDQVHETTKSWSSRVMSWKSVCMLLTLILLASGSRFVLLVIPAVLFICGLKNMTSATLKGWDHIRSASIVKILIYIGFFLLVGLIIGRSSLSRFYELWDTSIPWTQRWPRLIYWSIHWDIFLSHPIFGVSVAKVSMAAEALGKEIAGTLEIMNAHNLFLQFLADSGLVGLIGLLLLFGFLLKGAASPQLPSMARSGLRSLILGAAFAGISQNVLRDSEFAFTFWISLIFIIAYGATHLPILPSPAPSTK